MDDIPVAGAFSTILNAGVLGAVVIIFATVIVVLWRHFIDERKSLLSSHKAEREDQDKAHRAERDDLLRQLRESETKHRAELSAVHQARISDSEAVHKQMFEVVRQCTIVMESTSSALYVHKDAATEQREAHKESAEELRKLASLLTSLSEEIRARFRSR
jgi:hypothetical protein